VLSRCENRAVSRQYGCDSCRRLDVDSAGCLRKDSLTSEQIDKALRDPGLLGKCAAGLVGVSDQQSVRREERRRCGCNWAFATRPVLMTKFRGRSIAVAHFQDAHLSVRDIASMPCYHTCTAARFITFGLFCDSSKTLYLLQRSRSGRRSGPQMHCWLDSCLTRQRKN
jgi:hypothetical protein